MKRKMGKIATNLKRKFKAKEKPLKQSYDGLKFSLYLPSHYNLFQDH